MHKLVFLLVILGAFTACRPYGTQYEHPTAEIFYNADSISKEEVSEYVKVLEETQWIDSIQKSILIQKKKDTVHMYLTTLDRLRSDIPTEKYIAAIGIRAHLKLGKPVVTHMADNYLKAIRSYPAKAYTDKPFTYADTSVSDDYIQKAINAFRADTTLEMPVYMYIKKAGPAYHINFAYYNPKTLNTYAFQSWSDRMRKTVFNGFQVDVYLCDTELRNPEILFGRRPN